MTAELAVAVGVAIVLGALAHEAAHAVVANMLGATVVIDLWTLDVHYQFEDGGEPSAWKLHAINLAPQTAAMAGLVGWFMLRPSGGLTALSAALLVGLVVMAASGGLEDYRTDPSTQTSN